MKNVILITSNFPYEGGEEFLETEINYYNDVLLTIMPKKGNKKVRELPKHIKLDNFLVENSFNRHKISYLITSLRKKVFYKELFSENFLNFKKIKIFLSSMYLYQMYYELFDDYFSTCENLENIIVYTYWHNEISYSLQSLKDKYNFKLVSRIHGGDLYKERRPFCYMPLKKYFTKNIDMIYTITQSANQYLEDVYGFDKTILKLSRLGVSDKNIITKCSGQNSFNIVSCSYLTEVKRVDKIIDVLSILARKMNCISFKWTHIGGGILYDDLVSLAKNKLKDLNNLKYNFVGNYDNDKVYKFYSEHKVDVFLNVSESEGVPVSIMEAMSCHIPVVAPAVGGITDMIQNKENGLLLSSSCNVEEVVEAFEEIDFFKNKKVRDNAYQVFFKKYNAKKNYTDFVKNLIKMK